MCGGYRFADHAVAIDTEKGLTMRVGMSGMMVAMAVMTVSARGDESLVPLVREADRGEVIQRARDQDRESVVQFVNNPDSRAYEDRFYLAGIMGSSFGTLTTPGIPSATDSIFTSGGALGYDFELDHGHLRLEVEGRARDPIATNVTLEDGFSTAAPSATGGWSATVNLWRDFEVHDRVNCYVGGGIGGGGYQFGINEDFPIQDTSLTGLGSVTGFAWQAGGGLAWAITDGLTLDLGYRFFDLGAGGVTGTLSQAGVPIDTTRITSAFSASEIFFAFRIYEPFQGWW